MIWKQSKRILITGLALVAIAPLAYGQGSAQFESIFGGPWSDGARSLITLSDGSFVLGGWKTRETDQARKEGWVIKIDERGRYLWDLPLPLTGQNGILALSPALDGTFLAASDTDDGPRSGTRLFKISQAGAVEWSNMIGGRGKDRIFAIRPTLDGGFIMAGQTTSGAQGENDGWIVKLNDSLDVQWFRTIGGPSSDTFRDVAVTPEGSFVAVGSLTDRNGFARGWIVKIDPRGRTIWQETHALSDQTCIESIYPLLTGELVFIANTNQTTGNQRQAFIGSFNNQGGHIWTRALGSDRSTELSDLTQISEGYMVAVGSTLAVDSKRGLTVVFTPSGSSETLINHDSARRTQRYSIASTRFGSYAVSGTSYDEEKDNEDVWIGISREIVQSNTMSQELEQ